MSWRFFPTFLLRATGLPLEALRAVSDAGAAAADDATEDARLDAERRALFAALSEPTMREAVLTSAPLVDRNLDGWRAHAEVGRRNAQDKKRERVLWRFLQRLTAKNDSTSFFGAVAAGTFTGADEAACEVYPIAHARRAYATQWVVERLLARAVDELRAAGEHRPEPRRAAGADGDGIVWEPSGKSFAAIGDAPREVDLEALPSGLVDPIGEAVTRLLREPASALRDAWVARFEELAALRDAFGDSAGDLARRRDVLAAIDARVAALLGDAPHRHDGEFYASRSPVHEQAERCPGEVALPAAWGHALEAAVAPLLDLGLVIQGIERVTLRAWVAREFETSRADALPWRELLAELAGASLRLEIAAPPSVRVARAALARIKATLRGQVDDALAADPGALEVRLDPAAIADDVAAALAALGPLGVAYANPDFMIAHGAGATRFVLAEAHHLPCLTPCLLPSLGLAAGRSQVEAPVVAATRRFLAELTAPALPAFPVSYDHSFISVAPDLGAVGLELSGLAKEPPERRATFAELAVWHDGDALRFVVPSHAGGLLDVAPLTRTARLHQASPVFPLSVPDLAELLAAPDWRSRDALPRLAFGPLIVHRRRFRLEPADLGAIGDGADAGQRARELLARRAGIAEAPRFMFARMASEPKPILIDWGSAIATGLARWSLGRDEALELSEMLPAPDECWLRSNGGTHTAELRTVLVR